MTWYPGVNSGQVNQCQVPYFTGPVTPLSGAAYSGGHCIGIFDYRSGPVSQSFGWQVPAASFPTTLTAVRVYFARTGTVSGNLKVAVWRNQNTLVNFTSLPPDGTATIPLSSLPLVSAANNFLCVALPSYTEATLDNAITISASAQRLFIAYYLDNGFVNTSNVVIGCYAGGGAGVITQDSLDFSGGVNPNWYEKPFQTCAAIQDAKACLPDLNFGPVIVPAVSSWTAVIG